MNYSFFWTNCCIIRSSKKFSSQTKKYLEDQAKMSNIKLLIYITGMRPSLYLNFVYTFFCQNNILRKKEGDWFFSDSKYCFSKWRPESQQKPALKL